MKLALPDTIVTHWEDDEQYDNLAMVSTAIKLLRVHSHIKSLVYESAIADYTAPPTLY
ncbi:hypothetical protein PILCRDRAFT_824766 [Piloderma croceum F 1598]|uniref:Uncharacterized protein n=1 Tax=Piloderma croceum (strain F 1598) TaxID=765440 RepID=A0A0C3EZT5_PILCF|nr:hypothetical protein PILCRDRAFT_824766 [Piloderma croceum F 1598]